MGSCLPRACRRAAGPLAGRAGRDPRGASVLAPGRSGAVLGRAPRPRCGAHARAHALAEPPLLRVLRDHRIGARRPRRAPDRLAQSGRDPLADVSRAPGARGSDPRLARAAPRAAGGAARPHRGHRFDGSAVCARGCAGRASRPTGRPLLGACALRRRQGREAARARIAQGSGRRPVPHAPGAA